MDIFLMNLKSISGFEILSTKAALVNETIKM